MAARDGNRDGADRELASLMDAHVDIDPAEDMGTVVSAAQLEMERLIQLGGLLNDPLRHPIQALSIHLDVLSRVSRSLAIDMRQQVNLLRQPWAADERRNVIREAAKDMRGEVGRLVGAELRDRTLMAGIAGAVLLLVGAACGYLAGQHGKAAAIAVAEVRATKIEGDLSEAVRGLTAQQAYQWSRLIRWNSDVSLFRRECTRDEVKGHGREYCFYTLWDEPPPPPTVDQPGK